MPRHRAARDRRKIEPMTKKTRPAAAAKAAAPERQTAGRSTSREPKPDRRLAILLAAEKLFGLKGYHAVSIRDIAAEAGVPLALVGYYYGAKHELYYAIFQSWQPSIEQRLAGLRSACTDPQAEDALERIVDAFVSPVIALQHSAEGRHFAQMAARDLASTAEEVAHVQREFFDPLAHAFIDGLMKVFPAATRAQVAWCYQFALGSMLYFLLTAERAQRLSLAGGDASDTGAVEVLLRFIAAGFRGALPQAAARPAARKRAK
jgi:AcrR family transcriptional regulator